jgi:hypothetical protein
LGADAGIGLAAAGCWFDHFEGLLGVLGGKLGFGKSKGLMNRFVLICRSIEEVGVVAILKSSARRRMLTMQCL